MMQSAPVAIIRSAFEAVRFCKGTIRLKTIRSMGTMWPNPNIAVNPAEDRICVMDANLGS